MRRKKYVPAGMLIGVCLVVAGCATTSGEPTATGSSTAASDLSSCDAEAATGQVAAESKSSNGRTVEVRTPVPSRWSATPGSGGGRRSDGDGTFATVTTEIDFAPEPPSEPPVGQSPESDDSLGISVDSVRDGTVCGQPATLRRQHPTKSVSQNPYLRGSLMIMCACGGSSPVSVVVTATTEERSPAANTRSTDNDGPPSYPSRFEADIATILANVQITWKNQ